MAQHDDADMLTLKTVLWDEGYESAEEDYAALRQAAEGIAPASQQGLVDECITALLLHDEPALANRIREAADQLRAGLRKVRPDQGELPEV